MNSFLLSITFLFISLYSIAQCPVPQLSSWHFSDPENVEIKFYSDETALDYQLIVYTIYDASNQNPQDMGRDTITGASNIGLNTVSYNVVELLTELGIIPASGSGLYSSRYYYKVKLRVYCGSEWSDMNTFYMSPLSLFNNPDFSIDGELYMPLEFLYDATNSVVSVEIEIPEETPPVAINELGVFVDVGHARNSEIAINLTSPSGTTVSLLSPNIDFGNISGMSYYFTDDGNFDWESINSGFVPPATPLSLLNGEIASGTWTIEFIDTQIWHGGFVFGVALDINTVPCTASISGSAFCDFDSNGVQDGSDIPFPYAMVENTGSAVSFFTGSNGHFFRCLGVGSGNLTVSNPPLYYTSQPSFLSYNTADGDNITGLDFALTPIGAVNDLMVDMVAFQPDRPGFENSYSVYYKNLGTTCIDDIYIEIEVDPLLEILDVNASDYSITDNIIIVNVGALCPFESGTFSFMHHLNSGVPLGTILNTSATIYPLDGDESEFDNFSRLLSEVVGSYDPNDKQVSKESINEEFLVNRERLKYMVRFQNTGTYLAENVVVTDTLDESLDMSTFQLISTSHDMDITLEGNVLHFNFDDIMLPDSTSDLEASNGFLRYSIAPYSDLSEGTLIENTAYIYFDFNEPIITNTTETWVDFASGISVYKNEAHLYPNPANSAITILWSEAVLVERLLLYDITGKKVLDKRVSNSFTSEQLDVSHLASGSYVIYLMGDEQIKPLRWVKM